MVRLHNSRRFLRKLFSPLDPVMVADSDFDQHDQLGHHVICIYRSS